MRCTCGAACMLAIISVTDSAYVCCVSSNVAFHRREVREHGQAGLDQDTKAELERRKQEVAAKLQTERDHETKKVSERPDVIRNEQVKVVEQVIPVLEKDIYVPHRVEEEKYIKEIYNEKPVVKETIVEPTITRAEFEEK